MTMSTELLVVQASLLFWLMPSPVDAPPAQMDSLSSMAHQVAQMDSLSMVHQVAQMDSPSMRRRRLLPCMLRLCRRQRLRRPWGRWGWAVLWSMGPMVIRGLFDGAVTRWRAFSVQGYR